MKQITKIILMVMALVMAFFVAPVKSQSVSGILSEVVIYDGTVTNSTDITAYVDNLIRYDNGAKPKYFESITSVSVILECLGEIDLDSLYVTLGRKTVGGTFVAIGTPDTTVLTTNNADGTTTLEIKTASTLGTGTLTNYNSIKLEFIVPAAGNDATDPNRLIVTVRKTFTRYYIP